MIMAVCSGSVVGLSLGLIGGGGSILAVPLMVYVVGLSSPHLAIGTSAVAVGVNAFINLISHARDGNVKWRCALTFASFGVIGAAVGAQIGKSVDGGKLLSAFGVLMIVVAGLMLVPRKGGEDASVRLDRKSWKKLFPSLGGTGFGVGALSGFFGIGGGFLIVPGLVSATSMPLLNAIGSSLVSVAAFGATAAISYATSGLVNWTVAVLFVVGGAFGGGAGVRIANRLSSRKHTLSVVFSVVVALVGLYVVVRGVIG
jgi:uncharacterized membrane protein YfcA